MANGNDLSQEFVEKILILNEDLGQEGHCVVRRKIVGLKPAIDALMRFDKATIDLSWPLVGKARIFADGQVTVSLSRLNEEGTALVALV